MEKYPSFADQPYYIIKSGHLRKAKKAPRAFT